MVLGLKLHLRNHQFSSIPFTKLVRTPQSPLFQVQPIQASSFSPLYLKSRRPNPNVSYLERLDINGGGGGGGGVADRRKEGGDGGGGGGDGVGRDVMRLFLRGLELLLGHDREIMAAVGLPGRLAWLCVQATWRIHLALMGDLSGYCDVHLCRCTSHIWGCCRSLLSFPLKFE